MRILIRQCTLVQADPSSDKPLVTDILIEDETIRQVDDLPNELNSKCDQVLDGRDLLVAPGFIDADCHPGEILFRGEFENLDYDFRSKISHTEGYFPTVTAEDYFQMARMAAAQAVRHGVTTVHDHWVLPETNFDAYMQAIYRAYQEIGLRVRLAVEILPEDSQPGQAQSAEQNPLLQRAHRIRQVGERLFEQFHTDSSHLIQLGFVPDLSLLAVPEYQEWLHSLPERYQARLHTHLHPTQSEVIQSKKYSGLTPIHILHNAGLLNENLLCAHGTWLSPAEIELFSKQNSHLVHTPFSDLNLGNGLTALTSYLQCGAQVALGSGLGGNFNFFDTLKLTAAIHRIAQPQLHQWPSIAQVFELAILGGAKALNLDSSCGRIAPGYAADLVLYNLNSLALAPLNAAKSQLVCLETGQSIQAVMIHGKFVIQNGSPISFDPKDIQAGVQNLVHAKKAMMAHLQIELPSERSNPGNNDTQDNQPDALAGRWANHPASPARLASIQK